MAFPKNLSVKDDLNQASIKRFTPPDCSVWKAHTRLAWCYHVRGHSRASVNFAEFDGNATLAALEALRRMWRQFNDDKKSPLEFCPTNGIF